MLVFAACHRWRAWWEAWLRHPMTVKLRVTLNARSFHGASRWGKRLIVVVSLAFIPWGGGTAQVWVCLIHLTFERIYCMLILLLDVRPWYRWHRVLVIWGVSIRVRADGLRVQVGLRVFRLEALACIADSGRGVSENVSCLLLAKALFVVFVFFFDLSMLLDEHRVISLLALS